VRVGGAEDAFVAMGLGQAELPGARYAAGRAEELWSWGAVVENAIRENGVPEGAFGLLEAIEEVGVGVVQERAVGEVVIADFVAGGFNARDEVGMAEGALADQEECCVGVVLVENVEDLGREDGVRAVIEGESD
jgi:hypothetical protein